MVTERERQAFQMVPGVLCRVGDLDLVQEAEGDIVGLLGDGTEAFRWPTRRHAKGYLVVSCGFVRNDHTVAKAASRRVDLQKKQVEVHRLVAVLGRGANLRGAARGAVVHHLGLNPGDNRAEAIRVISPATHVALHAHLDALDPDELAAYVASIPGSPGGIGILPPSLQEMVASDVARFERT